MLEEIWDNILDGLSYLFGFEWLGDIWECVGSMFENISDFSILGSVLGLIGFLTVFLLRKFMLNPFLLHMGPIESIFWSAATYVGTFVAGYLVGKHFENT